ncbi:MAG: heme lyase CcmF/NrfE family subunit [Myxococcales bacterium]|nr:heme lyase CcmF/NrfE family subunit [Myxococcales bacterium]
MHDVGTALLYLAFLSTVATALVGFVGAKLRSPGLLDAGRHMMMASWLIYLAMSAALIYGLVTHDFSNKYIAAYTDRDMPFAYLLAGFWGGEKGALLFWTAVLSTFAVVSIGRNRTQTPIFLGWTSGVLHTAVAFFAALMVWESNPFEIFQAYGGPADGRGMNPLLQNPFMSIHPPAMLTGYMTFTVPFAFGAAALITGKLDSQWLRDTRQWTLVSWMFLTIGLILGGAWAYQELGWGGFWMWDPVENAGLIPWFTATAFLHSVMIQERRNMLRRWNAVLVCLTFLLTIFGTFLTRSQLIDSVHAFADSTLAPWFLWYMGGIFVLSVCLVAYRWNDLRAEAELDSMMSREAFFVLNNVLLVGCAFVVMWGTLFSKISEAEAFRALYNQIADVLSTVGIPADPMTQPVELGEAWFNRVMAPLGMALLLLTGVGPLISWRRATRKNFEKNFRRPMGLSAVITSILVSSWSVRTILRLADRRGIAFGEAYSQWADAIGRAEIYGVISVLFGVFVTIAISLEFHVGARARRKSRGESYLMALTMLTMRNKRRYGGYIVHLGIVFSFLAFAGNAFRIYQPEVALDPGDRTEIGEYGLMYTDSIVDWEPDGAYVRTRATMVVMDRKATLPAGEIAAVVKQASAGAKSTVTVDTQPGSPRIALTFKQAADAKSFSDRYFAQRLAGQAAVLPSNDPLELRLTLGETLRKVAKVAPRMAMPLFKGTRAHFTKRSAFKATVHTVPGQMDFSVRFANPAQKDRFTALMAAKPLAGIRWARFADKVQLKGGAGRVDVVPSNVGMLLLPEVRFYAKHSSPTTEVAIHSTFEHDLYLAMRPQQGKSFITLLAIVFPFVSFLWLGAIVMVLGGAICIWPTRRARPVRQSAPTSTTAGEIGVSQSEPKVVAARTQNS